MSFYLSSAFFSFKIWCCFSFKIWWLSSTNLTAGDEDRYKNMGDEVRTCNCIGCDACKADGCTNKFELPASQKAWLKQRGMFFTTRCSDCKAFPNPKFVKAQQRNAAPAPGAMVVHQAPAACTCICFCSSGTEFHFLPGPEWFSTVCCMENRMLENVLPLRHQALWEVTWFK